MIPARSGLRELPQRRHLGSKSREIIRRLGGDGKVELARDRLHELFEAAGAKVLSAEVFMKNGIALGFSFEHGGQESEALWLLIQRSCLLEIGLRLLEGAERHAAVHFCQLMGKRNEWGGITVPG